LRERSAALAHGDLPRRDKSHYRPVEPIVLIGSDAALKTGRQKENTP